MDLHCNSFGPTSLYQICESPGLLSRLEILDISGNPLTDGCAPYLSIILQKCKGLYRLNIERCSISSLTIKKITESLDSEAELSELFIGECLKPSPSSQQLPQRHYHHNIAMVTVFLTTRLVQTLLLVKADETELAVHDAMLEDVCHPAEIVGKRVRYRLDGSKIIKIYLDPKARNDTEYKLETFSGVYRKLSGKDVVFEYPMTEA
ncbi:ribosomal protein S7e [Artemisia annua]|uniref:Ribosomal protein S7e n=1 Tax=Artemisia annua TaxID=35608 RepID=A0A2U1L7F9_ARTAN|nr:ribosomal protein S7e [Artemisia annua]